LATVDFLGGTLSTGVFFGGALSSVFFGDFWGGGFMFLVNF